MRGVIIEGCGRELGAKLGCGQLLRPGDALLLKRFAASAGGLITVLYYVVYAVTFT